MVKRNMKKKFSISFTPKAIVVDVDGTLTDDDGLLNLKAVEYIRKIEDLGLTIMLASGNALPITKALSDYIGCSGPIIAEDGGVVYYRDKLVVNGDRNEALAALIELKKVFGKDNIIETFSNKYRVADVSIHRKIPINILKNFIDIKYPTLSIVDSKFAYHIHKKTINKGLGLKIACSMINVNVKDVIAIGDSELDIPMLKLSGYSIATANASSLVKSVVDYVTRHSYGDGFVEAAELIINFISKRVSLQ